MIFLNAPTGFATVWSILKPLADEDIRNRIDIYTAKDKNPLLKYVANFLFLQCFTTINIIIIISIIFVFHFDLIFSVEENGGNSNFYCYHNNYLDANLNIPKYYGGSC